MDSTADQWSLLYLTSSFCVFTPAAITPAPMLLSPAFLCFLSFFHELFSFVSSRKKRHLEIIILGLK